MKFFSKNSNLRIVLKHGIPAEPITGRSAVPGVYVRFEDGMVNVHDEEMIKSLKNHPRFNIDFVCDESQTDPFLVSRSDSEPQHIMGEVQYGGIVKRNVPQGKPKLSPELEKIVKEEARKMAKEILTDILNKSKAKEEGSKAEEVTEIIDPVEEIITPAQKPKKTISKKTVSKEN